MIKENRVFFSEALNVEFFVLTFGLIAREAVCLLNIPIEFPRHYLTDFSI